MLSKAVFKIHHLQLTARKASPNKMMELGDMFRKAQFVDDYIVRGGSPPPFIPKRRIYELTLTDFMVLSISKFG